MDAAERAGEIERNAREEAGEIRAAAAEAAKQVLEDAKRLGDGILGAQHDLTLLLVRGSKELDALQARLEEPQEPNEVGEDSPADKGIGEARVLMEVARARVRGKPDVELAETYDLALALVGRVADPGESVYWQAMLESAVEEAAARPAFGQPAEGEDVGGHRAQRRRRTKELKPLWDARRQKLEAASGRDGEP